MKNAETNYVAYVRVSTREQGDSRLGLEAQIEDCRRFVESQGGVLQTVFQDVESGKSRTRPGLWKAIELCRATGAHLVLAKLDRLARDVEFTFQVINTKIEIHFVDMPVLNTVTLGVMAAVAQYERELISTRTKAALAAKRARGESLGGDAGNWGRLTPGADRGEALRKARSQSVANRREAAMANPANSSFKYFIDDWQRIHGPLGWQADWISVAEELNNRGYKTSTGLEFTPLRARAMYQNILKLYGEGA